MQWEIVGYFWAEFVFTKEAVLNLLAVVKELLERSAAWSVTHECWQHCLKIKILAIKNQSLREKSWVLLTSFLWFQLEPQIISTPALHNFTSWLQILISNLEIKSLRGKNSVFAKSWKKNFNVNFAVFSPNFETEIWSKIVKISLDTCISGANRDIIWYNGPSSAMYAAGANKLAA